MYWFNGWTIGWIGAQLSEPYLGQPSGLGLNHVNRTGLRIGRTDRSDLIFNTLNKIIDDLEKSIRSNILNKIYYDEKMIL